MLRHTHTSLLAEAGIPLHIIQKRLGHNDESITKAIYLHITSGIRADVATKLDNMIQF